MSGTPGKIELAVIGASAGGIDALTEVFKAITSPPRIPIVVVLHIHPDSYSLGMLFQVHDHLSITEAEDGARIQPGKIYFAPPDYHLLIERDMTFSLSLFERINHVRPAVDPLFQSAARALRSSVVGVILSGAQWDGSLGMKSIKESGGMTVIQDPSTAQVNSMPLAAQGATTIDRTLQASEIGLFLMTL